MKIKVYNSYIRIIKSNITKLNADVIIHPMASKKTDEKDLRRSYSNAIRRASRISAKSIALSALGCCSGSFPATGDAKIMAQEILRHTRECKAPLKNITICLSDKKRHSEFCKVISGYINHVVNDLSKGPYVTVDAIIEMPKGIVLIERSNPPYGWALPGGFVDFGESLEKAVVREAKEETNLNFTNIRQMHTYSDPKRDPRFHTIGTVFIGRGKGCLRSGDDAKNARIVNYKNLTKLRYTFDHNKVIKDYLRFRKRIKH